MARSASTSSSSSNTGPSVFKTAAITTKRTYIHFNGADSDSGDDIFAVIKRPSKRKAASSATVSTQTASDPLVCLL